MTFILVREWISWKVSLSIYLIIYLSISHSHYYNSLYLTVSIYLRLNWLSWDSNDKLLTLSWSWHDDTETGWWRVVSRKWCCVDLRLNPIAVTVTIKWIYPIHFSDSAKNINKLHWRHWRIGNLGNSFSEMQLGCMLLRFKVVGVIPNTLIHRKLLLNPSITPDAPTISPGSISNHRCLL